MRGEPYAFIAVLLLGLASIGPGFATAAVLTVTDCGDTTPGGAPGQLRRLITDAAPGDTIEVPACLITLSGAAGEDANAGGDLDIGKALTIQGAGSRRTVIDGGAIDRVFDVFAPATVTLSDVMVRNGRGDGFGGGLRNTGTLTLNRVIVRANRVAASCNRPSEGGGIVNDGTLTVVESAIEQNVAGGCLDGLAGGVLNSGMLTLTRSTVSGNGASGLQSGTGGIANTGTLNLVDSTVSSNGGGKFGPGGISNGGTMSAIGSAIVNNGSGLGFANGVGSSGTATLTNTIIADNFNATPNSPGVQCAGVTSLGGNLATDDSCAPVGPGDAVVANAVLGPLSDQGGPTQTHPLLPGSPAIDTALPGACGFTDQRGMPRPQDGDGDTTAICDKGPFEFTPPIFADVGTGHFARGAIEALGVNGITGGCGTTPLMFCPDEFLTRAQVAVFLLRTLEGPAFTPPPATGLFADVPVGNPFAPWIEALLARGITSGCAVAPARFCPDDAVTRGQVAVLLMRTLAVPGFVPPAAVGLFADVPAGDPFAPWVEEFVRRGLTSGCLANPPTYCPADAATRAQIAIFLVRAFGFGF